MGEPAHVNGSVVPHQAIVHGEAAVKVGGTTQAKEIESIPCKCSRHFAAVLNETSVNVAIDLCLQYWVH